MTDTPLYSPSQINEWMECNRKWGWNHLDKIPRLEKASAAFGSKVHTVLEGYLEQGTIDYVTHGEQVGNLAAAMAPHLPAPRTPGLTVEHKWKGPLSDAPHQWNGRIDWLLVGPEGVTIGDHKTTSDISAWGKTAHQLRTDTQAIVYAAWAIREYNLDSVNLQWTYGQTKGPLKTKPVPLVLDREYVQKEFAKIDQIAQEITAAKAYAKTAKDLPYNSDSCDNYGGCPYQGNCNLSPRERLRSVMSAFSKHAKLPVIQEEAPTAAPAHSGLSALVKRDDKGRVVCDLQGRPLPAEVIEAQMIGGLPIDPIDFDKAKMLSEAISGPQQINPPESKLDPPVMEEEEDGPTDPVPAETDPVPNEKKKTRRLKPVKAVEVPETVVAAPEPGRLFLFIDCQPTFGLVRPNVSFPEVLAEARKRLQSEQNVEDYSLMEWGKGSGALAVLVEEIYRERLSQGDMYTIVDTGLRETPIVLSRLIKLTEGGMIVRGF